MEGDAAVCPALTPKAIFEVAAPECQVHIGPVYGFSHKRGLLLVWCGENHSLCC